MEAAGVTLDAEIEVRLDPRVTISQADLMARQDALMSAYELAKPVYEATNAVRRLTSQLGEVRELLGDNDDAPESIAEELETLSTEVRELGRDIGGAGSSRGVWSIEGSTSRPTDDQLRAVERAWEELPGLIEQLNVIITERMPALYRQLDEHGVRPDAGDPVEIPERP
jgi:hypothetical protein